jgi:enamine deaminase RidA (YjgF/YER057c/UK114 family)
MPRNVIYTDQLMRPIAHFSHATRVGTLVHVGASAGVMPDLTLAGESPGRVDIEAQTRRMFANLRTTLGLLGADQSDVVRIKAYVADPRDIARYQEIYRQEFTGMRPAHNVVGSWDFPLPQAAVEIDTVAMIGAPAQLDPDPGLSALESGVAGGVAVAGQHYATAQPIDDDGRVTSPDTHQQTVTALRNLSRMLAAAGLVPSDVCNLHVSVADMRALPAVERALSGFFGDRLPTWTVVGAPLEKPDFRVSIESTASKGGGQAIATKLSPLAAGRPAPAMLAGDTLFLSGQAVHDDSPADDVEAQSSAAWQRIQALVEAAGFAEDTMLRTNNVLTDWRDYGGFNRGYGRHVAKPYLPRATVLGQLSNLNARVQIEGIAHRGAADAAVVQVAPLVEQ